MQAVISKVNSVCSRLLDNAELMKLMPENAFSSQQVVGGYAPKYAALGLKNSRRKMEDRHVVIQDFNELYPGKVNISVIFFDFYLNSPCFLEISPVLLLRSVRWARRSRGCNL